MYSPGTIKAIGLMSRGLSADKAYAKAQQIDLEVASVRSNFYAKQALDANSFISGTAPLPAPRTTPSPSTVPSGQKTPDATTAQVTAVTPNTTVAQTFGDLQKQVAGGTYKRNTGGGDYLQGAMPTTAPPKRGTPDQYEVVVPSQKKIKTFFDQKFTPTPQDEREQRDLALASPLRNLPQDLYKQIPELTSGQWGLTDPSKIKDAAAEALGKYIVDKGISTQLSTAFKTDEQLKDENLAKLSMKQVALNFFNAENIDELKKNKKLLDAEIDKIISTTVTAPSLSPQALAQMPRGAAMDIAYSQSTTANKKDEILKVKQSIAETYKNEVYERVGDQIANSLEAGALQSADLKQYLKSLDGLKNVAGGVSALTLNFSDLVKTANLDSYLERALTDADVRLGGPQVLNEQALLRFNQKTPLTVNEAINEDRYNETRTNIVDAHLKVGQAVAQSLSKKNLNLIKQKEELLKENKPGITEEQFKKLETEFVKIDKQIELNQSLIEKTSEIHNYKALKDNAEIKNFAGSFLEQQEALVRESDYVYNKANLFEKGFFVGYQTSKKFLGGAANLLFKGVQGIGGMTGWDGLQTFGRYASNYVTPTDLINFDRVNNKGEYQTSNSFMFTDKDGETHWQPSALLYTGAETAPLVIATTYGASAISGLAGRALASTNATLVTKGLMSTKRAQQFTRALVATKDYGTAYRTVLSQSANPLVQGLAYSVPSGLAMGAIVYPQQFADAYEEMYRNGVKNARVKAHAVATVGTAIEILTENMFNDLKYLDDFAEKGIGASAFVKKYGGKWGNKWVGNTEQYRILYGDVFGQVFSNKTLDYLATRSANALGKGYAGARFMLARGVEEGREEVTSEIMNYFANNHMGLAAMQGQPPTELSTEGLVNTFAGALLGPPMGIGTQIKKYSENKKYSELFDIMLNAQYYKNKIDAEYKAGNIKQEDAARVLGKIQELETLEKEYGVRNLKNFQNNKSIETLDDLMEDPHLQYDYFKSILKRKSVEDKLANTDKATYTEKEVADLLAQGEEATKKIDEYKRRADFYSELTPEDKQKILDDNLKRKAQLSRLTKTEDLEKNSAQLEEVVAQAVANKRSEGFINSVRKHRDDVAAIKKEREQAELDATEAGTYNPLVDHTENKTPTTTLESIETQEEFEDALAQALLAPDRGADLMSFIGGHFDTQIEALKAEAAKAHKMFVKKTQGGSFQDLANIAADNTDTQVDNSETEVDTDQEIASLTPEQQDELAEIVAHYTNQIDDLIERKATIDKVLRQALNRIVPQSILDNPNQEEGAKLFSEWLQGVYERAGISAMALKEAMEEDEALSQSVFYDKISFGEYKAKHKDKIDKQTEEINKRREEQAITEAPTDVPRETVTSTETSTETGKKVEVVSPELLPEDVTVEFLDNVDLLESMPETQVVTTQNESDGQLVTTEEYNTEREKILSNLLDDILGSTSLQSAQAKLRVVMEATGATPEDINTTLSLLDRVSKGQVLFEEEHTHMFKMLLIQANMDLNKLKFEDKVVESSTQVREDAVEQKKQQELENQVQEIEQQIKALRTEDGSVPVDKREEFNRLVKAREEAKELARRGNSTKGKFIFRYVEGADNQGIFGEDKKEAADIIEKTIENSTSAEEAFANIRALGYVFKSNDAKEFINYLRDRFDPNLPRIGNNKDSFQAWIEGTTDAELTSSQQSTAVPLTITEEVKKQLSDLGYSKKDISKMTPQVAQTLIDKQTVKRKRSQTKEQQLEAKQLNLLTDQPRLTPEELAEREAEQRAELEEAARQREIDLQDAIADEELYMQYQADLEAFESLSLPPIAQALSEMPITKKSFIEFGDASSLEGSEGKAINFGYIRKNGFGVDQVAKRASDLLGREVSTQEVMDFILEYPGGIGGPTSKAMSTFYGSFNPAQNPKYSSISDLIKQRRKEAKARIRKEAKRRKLELPTSPFTPELNTVDAELNNQASAQQTNPQPPKTEKKKDEVNNQNQLMQTTPLFIPSSESHPDAKHFGVQDKITSTIEKEHRTVSTGLVDLFSVIEQVLGESTLQQMETIFNEVKLNPTPERLAELKTQFLGLFPSTFMKPSALNYMFDSQMVGKISQVKLDQEIGINLNASQAEIFALNKGSRDSNGNWQPKQVSQIKLTDGRVIRNVEVLSKDGEILFLQKTPILDAEGNEMLDAKGKPMEDKKWYPFNTVKNPETVLTYPKVANDQLDFKDLNTLTFTALDKDGRVQKFDSEGNKTNTGNQALLVYLPSSKTSDTPTPQQKAMDGLRGKIRMGERVNKPVKLNGQPRTDIEEKKDGTISRKHVYEFFTDEMIPVQESLSPTETKKAEKINKIVVNKESQDKAINALNELVAKAKLIPDPDKVGYIIDGEKYERQSGFTERTLGKKQVDVIEETEEQKEKEAKQTELKELGAAVGNLLDIIGRDVLGGRPLKPREEYIAEAEGMGKILRDGKGYKLELTQEQFDATVKELEQFKKELTRNGYKLFTEGLVVYRKFTEAEKLATGYAGVAGAMDIVAIDAEGIVHIIDFKNKKFRNEEKFKNSLYITSDKFPSNIKKWGSQQTTYAILAEDFGLTVGSINIYAYASQYQEKDGVITINMLTQASNKVPVLPQNKSEIADSVIKLSYDRNVMNQLDVRTVNPKTSAPIDISENEVNAIRETNKEFTKEEAENLAIILSSMGLTFSDKKAPNESDENPDTKNKPDCN